VNIVCYNLANVDRLTQALIDAYCTQLIHVNSGFTDQKPTKFTPGVSWSLHC